MNEGLIPSRYAKALYKYAQEHHVAAPIYEEMNGLMQLLQLIPSCLRH